MSVPLLKWPSPAPDQELVAELDGLARRLDGQQLWWASGYLAGRAAAAGGAAEASGAAASVTAPAVRWTVFFATETGNCRGIAGELVTALGEAGIDARAQDLADFRPALLKQESHAVFVVATHGIGEPPDGTAGFFDWLNGERAPRLDGLRYAVLALGDSSYDDFCETGRQLDSRLEALGALPLEPRVECDVDFEARSEGWIQSMLARARAERSERAGRTDPATGPHLVPVASRAHSRKNPFLAPVLEIQPITGQGSSKDVRHVVLSLEGSGLRYEPGDALGVWPTNPPQLVQRFLTLLDLDADAEVTLDDEVMPLGQALAHRLELTLLGRSLLEDYARRFTVEPLLALLEPGNRTALNEYLGARQVIDLLHDHPVAPSAQQLADTLKRVTPRLYSIASSLAANPDEVHLTVGVVSYRAFGRPHLGAASTYLAEPGDAVPVYVAPNPRFRLPAEDDAPVIMIGAGTGVAPYRAFLEEREARGARGDHWLFFGDRNFATDFLYQTEWARYRKSRLLTRHDVAFSRDQQNKVYVQDRLRERGAELFRWLERGAHLYVCGDAAHMAPDVHQALLEVVEQGLGAGRPQAEAYLEELKQSQRYQRDVY